MPLLRSGWVAVLAAVLSAACSGGSKPSSESTQAIEPVQWTASSPALLQLGRTIYTKECAACHGLEGNGSGDAAYLLYPKPRNFVQARYRIISTNEGLPTDEDLYRTISRGMPGSAMPSWAQLPEATRWALVHYIKTFAASPLETGPEERLRQAEGSGILIDPGARMEDSLESRERGRTLFLESCAGCHGPLGKGDGPQEQVDSEGFPTRPRDLTAGIYKGSPEPEQIYYRIVAGMPGSPMPSYPHLHADEVWNLVHYIRQMSSEEQRAREEMKQFRIVARRVDRLPDHPDASIWRTAPAVNLHLMPLWWRDNRPETVAVQALHDGTEIAIQLGWSDSTYDHTAIRPQDFRDAAAVQFSLDPDPPFFAMGEAAGAVNIWMWKAERQADLEPAFQDLEKVYPNIGIDSYPNLLRSPLEQPMREALTLESDPTFVTAWGAQNIVSDPTRRISVEDLSARGFGTLKARPLIDQQITAAGVYSTGSYRVVFRRSFTGRGENSVSMRPAAVIPVSFAVWDGSAGDRDGQKSVTIWQELFIEP